MKRLSVLLMLMVCVSVSLAGQTDRKFWTKRYSNLEKMFNDRDIQAIEQLLADKFEVNDQGKRFGRSDYIKYVLEPIAQASHSITNVRVTGVHSSGKDVRVNYDLRYYLTYDDPKMGKYKARGREVGADTWHNFGGTWLIVRTNIDLSTQQRQPSK